MCVCTSDLFMTLWFYPCEFVAAAATTASLSFPHNCPTLAIIYLLKFQNLSQNPYRGLNNLKIKSVAFPNTNLPGLPIWSQFCQNNSQFKVTLIKVTFRCHSSYSPNNSGPCAGTWSCLGQHTLAVLTHPLTSLLLILFPCFTFQVISSFILLPTLENCRYPRLLSLLQSQHIIPGPLILAPKLFLINLFLFFPFDVTPVQTLCMSPLSYNRNLILGRFPSGPSSLSLASIWPLSNTTWLHAHWFWSLISLSLNNPQSCLLGIP